MEIGQPKIGQTRWGQGRVQPGTLIGTDRRTTSGPAVIQPRKQAGHMTARFRSANIHTKKFLASQGPSTHDPNSSNRSVLVMNEVTSCQRLYLRALASMS